MQNTSDSVPLGQRIPQSWGQVVHGSSSSVYLSASNSLQPSRESSRFNLSSFLQGSRDKDDVEDSKGMHSIPLFPLDPKYQKLIFRARNVFGDGYF